MSVLLQAAGAKSSSLLKEYQIVCDTCRVCRPWTRPGARPLATTRLAAEFNQHVEVDLLFGKKHTILHAIDGCIRWTVCVMMPDKTADTIC